MSAPDDQDATTPRNGAPLLDLGWNGDPENISTLMEGMSNDYIFMLVRRFNKVNWYLKDSQKLSAGGLDLAIAPEQEFSPNKFRSQLERFYMSVIVRIVSCVKHVARIRSWNERVRTSMFCSVYCVLWWFDVLVFGALAILLILLVSPTSRRFLFPPAPLSLVDSASGGLAKPMSGVLGSDDSITGAPEHMKGQAVESEASNFVNALSGIGTNIMTGRDLAGEPNAPGRGSSTLMQADPSDVSLMIASAKDRAEGVEAPSHDKSKTPMESMMWSKTGPAMHALTVTCDIVEKSANALNRQSPFRPKLHRYRLASAVVPFAATSLFVTGELVWQAVTLIVGVFMFCRPITIKLQERYPNLTITHIINNGILYGVPSDPQLALAVLREGERRRSPLPPPPRLQHEPPHSPLVLDTDVIDSVGRDQPLGASNDELMQAAAPDHETLDDAGGVDVETTRNDDSEGPHRIMRFLKGATRIGVKSAIAFDKTRAKLGHSGAQRRSGVVPKKHVDPTMGPYEFDGNYEGQAGFLYIDTSTATPLLAFNEESAQKVARAARHIKPLWTFPVSDIKEIRKHSGYGFKSKLIAGWALDKELHDSLSLLDRNGNNWLVTAIPHRDAVFNRLVAIADQRWEVW
ncbi:hypothetical protein Slin15195_G096590 [Septoria linicola]|uniref:Uncharacterized protein n=1 Tax=Septoria linicola TaxID=215465 RepID=A0A9Q9EMS2_9PEZI|nr:hypothetical protein Slin14017_G059680 [Septoria linicola]USW56340.1 hypothetical protein Slin15195_G096590 [Septoria linicola]